MGEVQPLNHEYFIAQALELAQKAKGLTHPNPPVGALVINQNNQIIGRGFHPKAGEPHAEVFAIDEALQTQANLSFCTLYVTLEPCNHHGKTPPCVEKIISSGIKNVVTGCLDPNPLMSGKSLEILKLNGVQVENLQSPQCEKLIRGFKSFILNQRPFVTLKCAATLDGKISTSTGESKWITSSEARAYAHQLRAEHDAVLIGIGTLLGDDPQLDARFFDPSKKLVKVVLDPRLETPVNAKILNNSKLGIIFCDQFYSEQKRKDLEKVGYQVVPVLSQGDELELIQVLKELLKFNVQEVFVEGGTKILGSFLKSNLFDQVHYFMAPKILGQNSRSVFEGYQAPSLNEAFELSDVNVKQIGPDFIFEGRNVHGIN